ncbi:MAG TPA: hypothetical protein VF062_19060 [Candidatus Limnocylindrales bacterium]
MLAATALGVAAETDPQPRPELALELRCGGPPTVGTMVDLDGEPFGARHPREQADEWRSVMASLHPKPIVEQRDLQVSDTEVKVGFVDAEGCVAAVLVYHHSRELGWGLGTISYCGRVE